MFSYHPINDPNLSHSGFYIITFFFILFILIGIISMDKRERIDAIPLWIVLSVILGLGYYISYSEWEIPENKEYTAKFIQFVPERQKHQGIKGQISYSSHVFCEYEIDVNKQLILMPCDSKQSPPYIKVYWNRK